MTSVKVCTGNNCGPKGGVQLLRDIEELAGGGCKIEIAGCLDNCYKGPNVEVNNGGKKKLIEGVDSFKKAENIVSKEAGCKVGKLQRQCSELKFAARRDKNATARLGTIQKAMKLLGDEKSAAKSEPRLLAELLVMRAAEFVTSEASKALEDAELALECAPAWGLALFAVAQARHALGQFKEAIEALDACQNSDTVMDMKPVYALEKKLEDATKTDKAKEDTEKKKAVEEAAEKKAAEEGKKKAAAEDAKRKADEDAKKKEEAKKKAAATAARKKKAEAEAKKKAGEEEAMKKAEEEESLKAEEEAKAKAEAEQKAAEEEVARKQAEEQEEEERRRKEAAEQDRLRAEEEQRREEEERLEKAMRDRQAEVAQLKKEQEARRSLFACCRPTFAADESGDIPATYATDVAY